ncbi:hypothetical protein [Nocardia salmonicida]|uniref:hypothetical protein n=1 Tax=Nocardia salmonicida TaxID=53431 RepID=UPI003CF52E8C
MLSALRRGPRGITVNAVAPGYVLADMNAWLIDNPDGQREASSNDDVRWNTGQTLDASGGTVL